MYFTLGDLPGVSSPGDLQGGSPQGGSPGAAVGGSPQDGAGLSPGPRARARARMRSFIQVSVYFYIKGPTYLGPTGNIIGVSE